MRRGRGIVAAAVAAVAVLLLLWGSSSGDSLVGYPEGVPTPPVSLPEDASAPTLTQPEAVMEGQQEDSGSTLDLTWVAVALVLALTLLVMRLLVDLFDRDWDQPVADEPEDELIALLDATDEQRRARLLADGDPRNAVVACWVVLEEAVQRAGLRRDAAETSAELTRRILARWQIDTDVVDELSQRFREARFSQHPVTEAQRDRAAALLEQIHDELSAHVQRSQPDGS